VLLQLVHQAVVAGGHARLPFPEHLFPQGVQHPFGHQPQRVIGQKARSAGTVEGKRLLGQKMAQCGQ
jgi:hypothetical protein